MASALEQEMYNYFSQLNEAEKKSVTLLLKIFLNERQQKSNQISIEQYNREIEQAEIEIEQGNCSKHDDVAEMSKTWINVK